MTVSIPDYLISGEPARLIPVAADSSKEGRAASILLATLANVRPFAQVMLASVGQRVGTRANINGYTEVVFRDGKDAARTRPDGLLTLDGGGGRLWRCLVEAKIGRSELEPDQVTRYLSLAKHHKIDAVLTISNQFVALPTHSPISVPKTTLRGVGLLHWSWMYVLTHALLLLDDETFGQPDQRYILSEMVRYLSHPSVGVSTFKRMNAEWKDLNAKVQAGANLTRSAAMVENAVAAWHQEGRDLCLQLARKVGRAVRLRLSRAHADDPVRWLRDDVARLVDKLELSCSLQIPDAAAPILVIADLQRRTLSVLMTLAAPQDKRRAKSRINWILRQLTKANPDGLHVRANWPGRAPDTQAALAKLREDATLLEAENKSLVPTHFEVLLVRDMAGKFGGTRTFIEHLEEAVPHFYEQVGQHLRAYVPPPPPLRKEDGKAKNSEEPLKKAAEKETAEAEAVKYVRAHGSDDVSGTASDGTTPRHAEPASGNSREQ